MTIALEEAKEVKKDIPVAALIVKDNKIISLATNKREENNQTIAHVKSKSHTNADPVDYLPCVQIKRTANDFAQKAPIGRLSEQKLGRAP